MTSSMFPLAYSNVHALALAHAHTHAHTHAMHNKLHGFSPISTRTVWATLNILALNGSTLDMPL
jgi:hypothetical protein